MARYTILENNDQFARVQQDGVDNTWSTYILDGPPTEVKSYSRARRGFASEVEALQWAHQFVTGV